MNFDTNLGTKIRNYRKEKQLTLQELAKQAEISSSMLSQIERGGASPSLNTIRLLAIALDEPIYKFFLEENASTSAIVKEKSRKHIMSESVEYEILTPDMSGNVEMMRMIVNPGCVSCKKPLSHKGEEVAMIEKGTLTLNLGNKQHVMHTGDSIRINGNVKHQWINKGDTIAVLIFAVSPPSF